MAFDLAKQLAPLFGKGIEIDILGVKKLVIPVPNALFVFDIDGVVCEVNDDNCKYEAQLSNEDYVNLMKQRKCITKFVQTAKNILENGFEIAFLTGRKAFASEPTEQMFADVNLPELAGKVIYYPDELSWISDDYIVYKFQKIAEFLANHYVYFFDDNKYLIGQLREQFRNLNYENLKIFLCTYDGFNDTYNIG
jgi:hypothetical protein